MLKFEGEFVGFEFIERGHFNNYSNIIFKTALGDFALPSLQICPDFMRGFITSSRNLLLLL